MDGDGRIRRDQPGVQQGSQGQGDRRRITARIRNTPGLGDGLALALAELRQSVHPAVRDPVGRAGIEDLGIGRFEPAGGLLRSRVGEAQDRDLGRLEGPSPGAGILSVLLLDFEQLEIVATREPLADAQASRSRMAVDENRNLYIFPSFFNFFFKSR